MDAPVLLDGLQSPWDGAPASSVGGIVDQIFPGETGSLPRRFDT